MKLLCTFYVCSSIAYLNLAAMSTVRSAITFLHPSYRTEKEIQISLSSLAPLRSFSDWLGKELARASDSSLVDGLVVTDKGTLLAYLFYCNSV